MEDRGCTPAILRSLYIEQSQSLRELQTHFGVSQKVINRWLSESGIEKRKSNSSKYVINQHFFDLIDTEEKAYWIGFIWCDGYVLKRSRKSLEYSFKLALSEKDEDHLYKFRSSIESDSPIYRYEVGKGGFSSEFMESRFRTSNKHLGSTLYHSYGLIPNRYNTDKLINRIPDNLVRHFIRGIYDAEGSVSVYYHKVKEHYNPSLKMVMGITSYSELLEYIQNHFIEVGLKNNKIATEQRHKGRDQHCLALKYSGARQVTKILDYLYQDATIYLERKYKKYQDIKLINKGRCVI